MLAFTNPGLSPFRCIYKARQWYSSQHGYQEGPSYVSTALIDSHQAGLCVPREAVGLTQPCSLRYSVQLAEQCKLPLPLHHPWACKFHIAALSPLGNLILAFPWLEQAYLPVDVAVRKLEFLFSFGDLNPDLKTFLMLLSPPKIRSMCLLKLFVSASTVTPK